MSCMSFILYNGYMQIENVQVFLERSVYAIYCPGLYCTVANVTHVRTISGFGKRQFTGIVYYIYTLHSHRIGC